MRDTSFFSSNKYVFLPTKKSPKVAIVVDNFNLTKNSFKLYNPFSFKGKILKKVSIFFYLYLNKPCRLFASKKEKSDFVHHLEKILNQPLVVSVYFATINDKVVLQIQSIDAKILGYVKYPLNAIGTEHINNEIQALKLLVPLKIVKPCILCGDYDNKPFLFIHALNGEIGLVEQKYLDAILSKLKKEISYRLVEHPRILKMIKLLLKNNMSGYSVKVSEIVENSTTMYKLAYEHGDFTPWNIVKIENDYMLFDFEYFEKDGLEYFDIIKYYYQIGRLLKKKVDKELIEFVCAQIKIKEIKKLLKLFLIKEILIGKMENKSFKFEEDIFKVLERL